MVWSMVQRVWSSLMRKAYHRSEMGYLVIEVLSDALESVHYVADLDEVSFYGVAELGVQ